MIKLLDLLNEIVTATQVICDNCGHSWDIIDGGDDLYICHDCNHYHRLIKGDGTLKLKIYKHEQI